MEYYLNLAIFVGIYAILAQSFNLIFGLGRLLNLAHVSSFAIGAYTTAILATRYEWGPLYCIPASFICGGLFAASIGIISMRLSGDYFAVGSLAFAAMINALLINWKGLTNGVLGIPGIPRPIFGGVELISNKLFLIGVIVANLLVQFVLFVAFRNSFSRRLRAQGELELVSKGLGVHTGLTRFCAFFLGSASAGLSGSLFAYYIQYIDPSSFSMSEMIFVLTIVIVGKPGSYWGVLLSTIFMVLLPEPIRFIDLSPGILGPMRQMIYAVVLFSVVYWKRATLFPAERRV